jgi:ribonuclease E
MGLIIRTAGVGKSLSELKWDLESLMNLWKAIEDVSSQNRPAPFLVYQEGDAVMRAIRDYLRQDIVEILVDNQELFERTKKYIEQVKPDFIDKIKLYENKVPLFSFYQIEKQIETAYQRVVKLLSGGSISIDHTEALVSIDVNSAKATGGSDIEETAFNTNVEAAEEIARQLRLRDIGGLIVIDFIDMSQVKHQREVSRKLREALEYDRARVQVGHITRFGLLEMSRQRLRSYLGEATQVTCPRCDGQGTIRSVESLASSLIRIIEEEAAKEKSAEIQLQAPVELATFMLNEQRNSITGITKRQNTVITILPNKHLETPKYKIKQLNKNEAAKNKKASYKIVETPELETFNKQESSESHAEEPAVNIINEGGKKQLAEPGFFHKLVSSIGKMFKKSESSENQERNRNTTKRLANRNQSSQRARIKQSYRGQKKYRRSSYGDCRQENRNKSYSSMQKSSRSSSYSSKKTSPPPSEQYPELTAEKVKDNPDSNNINSAQTSTLQTDSTNNSTPRDPQLFESASRNRTITSSYSSAMESDKNLNPGSGDVELAKTESSE